MVIKNIQNYFKAQKILNIQEKQDKNYITTIISITKNNFWQQLPGFFAYFKL